ncbi:hypothetical protein EZV62_004446 [Acer yangbiense]|uniref:RNase H type-1 domain-containing protein n=1 Tax=Acer yangbiense TaxID=1000413 RepID=A0A5C7IJZ1_9ROSI|nr:hypothetical protein EZV62_004446 [Acer yangbiense]
MEVILSIPCSMAIKEDSLGAVIGRGYTTAVVWCPLAIGQLKINSDVAVDVLGKKIGIGIVIRDHTGFVMASCAQKINVGYSPVVAEAVALLRGLQFVKDTRLGLVVVELDAAVVVAHVNDTNPTCDDHDRTMTTAAVICDEVTTRGSLSNGRSGSYWESEIFDSTESTL